MGELRPGQMGPPNPTLVARLLDVIERDVIPLTQAGVSRGNKIFGAAMLRKSDLSLVHAATNGETSNPLFHGEVACINEYYALVAADPSKRVDPADVIFLATHEPCTLCSSAITWAGHDNFYYFFSHEDSRDAFQIGHDLNILKQVFKHEPGGYARANAYFTAFSLQDMIRACDAHERAALSARADGIRAKYMELSEAYQSTKELDVCRNIPLK